MRFFAFDSSRRVVAQTWTAAKNSCDGMATTANIQIFYSLAGSTLAPQAVITAARLSYSTTTYARARTQAINTTKDVLFYWGVPSHEP